MKHVCGVGGMNHVTVFCVPNLMTGSKCILNESCNHYEHPVVIFLPLPPYGY